MALLYCSRTNPLKMKWIIFARIAVASSEFTRIKPIKPINPIPAGSPGLCCQELVEYPLAKLRIRW